MTDRQRLAIVRGLHTAIYGILAAATLAILYAGLTGVHGAWLWPALALVGVESVVFVAAGLKCPLTALVARYAGKDHPVSDTFLPERLTRHTMRVFGPLVLIGVLLLAARGLGLHT
jgi:hypothetical protein